MNFLRIVDFGSLIILWQKHIFLSRLWWDDALFRCKVSYDVSFNIRLDYNLIWCWKCKCYGTVILHNGCNTHISGSAYHCLLCKATWEGAMFVDTWQLESACNSSGCCLFIRRKSTFCQVVTAMNHPSPVCFSERGQWWSALFAIHKLDVQVFLFRLNLVHNWSICS